MEKSSTHYYLLLDRIGATDLHVSCMVVAYHLHALIWLAAVGVAAGSDWQAVAAGDWLAADLVEVAGNAASSHSPLHPEAAAGWRAGRGAADPCNTQKRNRGGGASSHPKVRISKAEAKSSHCALCQAAAAPV